MAILKCTACGGDLEIIAGESVAECLYCGTKQTVPSMDNEKKLTLFNRANRLRFGCEFDKASGIYEAIVADFPEEAEAYWGLVLCKYGIEYVDDPATGKKIPTCHRSSFDSIMDDPNFDMACEYADPMAHRLYRERAKQFEELRKGIIEVSGKEDPYDIFICYKESTESNDRTLDSELAQDVYDILVEKGYRVFFSRITLEDKLGQEFEPYIFAALNSAKLMLVFGTAYEHFNAVWVKNEWSRYLQLMTQDKTKHLIPCYKGIDAYDMPKEFAKLQAQDMGKVGAVQDLLRGIEKLLPKGNKATSTPVIQQVASGGPNIPALLKRGSMALEDEDWGAAEEYFDQVLNMDAECVDAYLGLLMANIECKHRGLLKDQAEPFDEHPMCKKLFHVAEISLKEDLQSINAEIRKRNEAEHELAKKRMMEEYELAAKRVADARERNKAFAGMLVAGDSAVYGLKADGTVVALGQDNASEDWYGQKRNESQCNVHNWKNIVQIAAGKGYVVALRSDGTVVATGNNKSGECDVQTWTNIIQVATRFSGVHLKNETVALRSNGTVVTTHHSKFDWKNVANIYAKYDHIYGIKTDGTVLAAGDSGNKYGEYDVQDWKDIVQIAVGDDYVVGLKSDGTVMVTGNVARNLRKVQNWNNIVDIYLVTNKIYGLRADGTILSATEFPTTRDVELNWKDIVHICEGKAGIFGLAADGTVYSSAGALYNTSNWKDIVAICQDDSCLFGLQSDGTVVVTGVNTYGQYDARKWKLFETKDVGGLNRKQVSESDIYISATAKEKQNTVVSLREAAEMFQSISGYKDADGRAVHCFEQAEIVRKDSIYNAAEAQAKANLKNHVTDGLEEAAQMLETIPGWRDADKKAAKYRSIYINAEIKAIRKEVHENRSSWRLDWMSSWWEYFKNIWWIWGATILCGVLFNQYGSAWVYVTLIPILWIVGFIIAAIVYMIYTHIRFDKIFKKEIAQLQGSSSIAPTEASEYVKRPMSFAGFIMQSIITALCLVPIAYLDYIRIKILHRGMCQDNLMEQLYATRPGIAETIEKLAAMDIPIPDAVWEYILNNPAPIWIGIAYFIFATIVKLIGRKVPGSGWRYVLMIIISIAEICISLLFQSLYS